MPSDPALAAVDPVAPPLSRQFTDLDTALVARVVWDTYQHFDAHPTKDVVLMHVGIAILGVVGRISHPHPYSHGASSRSTDIRTASSRRSGWRSRDPFEGERSGTESMDY